jgi:photosystem II protein
VSQYPYDCSLALTTYFSLIAISCSARENVNTVVVASSKKTDISKQGLNSIDNKTVRLNLMGRSESMEKKGWVDPQGRKGKGYGVYKFANKYGANVDGYSPIYTPDTWSESGDSYKLGTTGLIAWAGLIVVLLGVGVNLVISTSAIGQ